MTGAVTDPLRARKAELRKQVIAARDALSLTERERLSAAITARILALDAWRSARCVLAFMTFGSEFDTAALIADARAAGRTLVLPRVDYAARRLVLHGVADPATDLATGKWGIREPDPARCPVADPAAIDFVVMPGVAFTVGGKRLGYGAGFYDRLIPTFPARPPLVAAAFELQVVDDLPMTERDQRVDLVVTEKDAYLAC